MNLEDQHLQAVDSSKMMQYEGAGDDVPDHVDRAVSLPVRLSWWWAGRQVRDGLLRRRQVSIGADQGSLVPSAWVAAP